MHAPGTPVPRIGLAPNPARLLEPLDRKTERRLLDIEQVGDIALAQPRLTPEHREDAPLGLGEAQVADRAIEAAPDQARGIVDQERAALLEIVLGHGPAV